MSGYNIDKSDPKISNSQCETIGLNKEKTRKAQSKSSVTAKLRDVITTKLRLTRFIFL